MLGLGDSVGLELQRPLPELSAAVTPDAESNRQNRLKPVVSEIALDLALPLPTRCLFRQLPVAKNLLSCSVMFCGVV